MQVVYLQFDSVSCYSCALQVTYIENNSKGFFRGGHYRLIDLTEEVDTRFVL